MRRRTRRMPGFKVFPESAFRIPLSGIEVIDMTRKGQVTAQQNSVLLPSSSTRP